MNAKIGSLFSGYGGLDLAVEAVLGAKPSWFVEFDKAPSKILAHHWPNITNYGDVTKVDWAEMPKVDILTGGSPCQDLSLAGRRAGMTEGTRSNLWVAMREAIAEIQPKLVIWENVQGALSAKATSFSDVEPEPGLLGGDEPGHLRALGRVLGDLAEIGYDARWTTIRASDVGAPHHRARVFLVAYPYSVGLGEGGLPLAGEEEIPGINGGNCSFPADSECDDGGAGSRLRGGWAQEIGAHTTDRPQHSDCEGDESDSNSPRLGWERGWAASKQAEGESAQPQGLGDWDGTLGGALRFLPTPNTMDHLPAREGEAKERQLHRGDLNGSRRSSMGNLREDIVHVDFGKYEPAVRRWEEIVGPAPAPTEPNSNGKPRLNAAFAEWMMGLPPGWVTSPEIGLSRKEQLKAIGNGVCPQQAVAAIEFLLSSDFE